MRKSLIPAFEVLFISHLKQEKGLLDRCSELSFKCLGFADPTLQGRIWEFLHELGRGAVNNSPFVYLPSLFLDVFFLTT